MRNLQIAWVLREIADLLEFKGEEFYKVRAYRRAAKSLAGITGSVEEMYKDGSLQDVPGIGKNILAKIGEILETGECKLLQQLREEIPPGVLEMMAIPGVGQKKAAVFYEQLHIKSVDELEQAARSRQLRQLPGMGAKREQEILNNIKMQRANRGIFLLSAAMELAGEFTEFLREQPFVIDVEVAGSTRRWCKTVRDLDLLVCTDSPGKVVAALQEHPMITGVIFREEQRSQLMTSWGLPLEVLEVSRSGFPTAFLRATGSNGHWEALQKLASGRGMTLATGALYNKQGNIIPAASEGEIYNQLGLAYIPPEMRENSGELELAAGGKLPPLVDAGQIRGDLHTHTRWSDGGNTIEELVARAQEKGYKYIAVTDHSRSLKVAGGLSVKELRQQHDYIRALNRDLHDFTILTGTEVDILPDGTLDYPGEVLEQVDLVIASVHTAFKQDREKMTERIIAAVENPQVDVIGHLTGRMIGTREGYNLDTEKVIRAAAAHNKALEINSSPDRMDLNEENARLAAELGVKLAIGTDAHDLRRMDEIVYGISITRRAWLGPENILNTLDTNELLQYLGRSHG